MPNINTPPTTSNIVKADTELFLFKAVNPTKRYPSFVEYQVNKEVADLLIPVEGGSALVEYIDSLPDVVVYQANKLADYTAYLDTLMQPKVPKFAAVGTYRVVFQTSVPVDNMFLGTVLDYRTLSAVAANDLLASAVAGELTNDLLEWAMTHSLVLESCGGFTLVHVQVTETLPKEYEVGAVPNRHVPLAVGGPNQRRSFKSYLAASFGRGA